MDTKIGQSDIALVSALSPAEKLKDGKDLKKTAMEFESLFLNHLLKTMRESIPKNGLFGGGQGEEIYTSMLDDFLSREMAMSGGIGLAEILTRQLEAMKGKDGA